MTYPTPPQTANAPVARKSFLDHFRPQATAVPPAPGADHGLSFRPDAEGKINIAGHRIPAALAVLGVGLGAVLLVNKKTRGPAVAALGMALGSLSNKR